MHSLGREGLIYAAENHHVWALHDLPGLGPVLVDSNLFETVLRGRFNWTAFGNAQRGLDKIHVQYIDGNVLPGQRPSLVPKCGICNAIVVVDVPHVMGWHNGCRSMRYCCSEHQRLHWPLHRVVCKQLQKTHAVQLIAQPEDTHMTPE